MADSFVDSIGVNTHLGSQASPYYTNFGAIVSAFQVSGIRHARDAFWFDWDSARGKSLISQVNDVKFLLTLGGNCNITRNNVHPENYLAWGFTTANIDAFEGMNEVSGCTDSNPPWYVNARNGQQYLWEAVKGNPQLAAIPVIGPSLYAAHETELRSDSAAIGDLTAYMNYGNEHDYTNEMMPSVHFSYQPSAEAAMNGALPVWGTEAGYPQSYIPLDRANKYYSRLFFENFNHGIVRTYAYELIDENNRAGGEATFGLLYSDGTPKPQFTTVSNIISILKDPGSAFTPGALNYSIVGGPATLHHTLLQKRNGVFYLVLWLEQNWWESSSATVTVNFAGTYGHINQFDPLTSTSPKVAWNNVSAVVLTVSDQATILEISSSVSSPDLIPTPNSLSYNTTTHLFTIQVKNQGTGSTPAGVIIGNAFNVDGTQVTWGAVPGPVAAGASVSIDSSGGGAYTIPAGTHTISVWVDDVNRMAESNKSNNQLSKTITVP